MIVDKIDDKYLINITQKEALSLIKSLSTQLVNNESNIERLESYTDKGEYCSIFVLPDHFNSTREYTEWVKSGMETIKVKGKT
jgi:hypothetical protein